MAASRVAHKQTLRARARQAFIELASKRENDNQFFVLSAWMGNEMYRYLNSLSAIDGIVPSTGFYAAIAAVLSCRRVSLYAFGDTNTGADHYWARESAGRYDRVRMRASSSSSSS